MYRNKFNVFLRIVVLTSATLASTASLSTPFNWCGAYVGGFSGGAFGTSVTSTEPFRLNNKTYWHRPYHHSFGYQTSASFIGGVTIGYNWQCCQTPFLISLEGEYGFLSEHGSSGDPNQRLYAALPGNNLFENSRSTTTIGDAYGYVLVSGRLGYALDRMLFYLKSGAVFTNTQSTYNSVKTEDLAPVYLHISGSKNITGYGVGAGIEYVFPPLSNISAKIEYLYLGIDDSQYVYGHCSCHFLWRTTEHINGIHTAKFGINYNFH